ncbi:MAG: CPBP family intramembrane metalloprotease [Blastocatellia bacterium]|nr:CPBP family intramembrane metalloprotease [Blastocatellia bacterium]
MKNKPILLFMLVTCGYSWTLWGLRILSELHVVPFKFNAGPLGSFGPVLGALVVSFLLGGKAEVRKLLRPLSYWDVAAKWYAFATLSIVGLYAISVLAYCVANSVQPAFENLHNWVYFPLLFVVILIIGGPLGEEIGWRGFALPRLLERFNGLVASLILSLFWVVWHLPLFWLEGAAQQGTSVIGFSLVVVAFSILYTWLYNQTGGSLLVAILYHASINTFSFCFQNVLPGIEQARMHGIIFLVVTCVLALAVLAQTGVNLGKPAPEQLS